MNRPTKADRERDARSHATIALRLQFKFRKGKRAYVIFDEAVTACEGITVSCLLDGSVTEAKAWARASVLLNDRLKRLLR